MKNCIKLAALGLCLLLMPSGEVAGQTSGIAPSPQTWSGRVVLPPDQTPTADSVNVAPLQQRPALTERNKLPPEVQAKIRDFRRYAQKYMEQQEQLKRQLYGATDEQRAKIREQLNEAHQQLLERAREVRQEALERLRDLKEKLPSHREMLDEAREAAREQLRNQRTRPGLN